MNCTALITGASRGIGRGIALELAGRGWDVILNYVRNTAAAEQTARDCAAVARENGHSIRATAVRADITLAEDRARLLRTAETVYGHVDLLVNNAGVAPKPRADLLEATEESFDRVMATNLKAPYLLTQAVARWMRANQAWYRHQRLPRPAPQIVFISSISACAASVDRGDYCVAKAGVSMLAKLFADRLAGDGIQVFEIRPGIVETDMTAPVKEKYDALIAGGLTPIRRWGLPDDVGKAVVAVAQRLLPFSTGEVIHVDGGFHLRRL